MSLNSGLCDFESFLKQVWFHLISRACKLSSCNKTSPKTKPISIRFASGLLKLLRPRTLDGLSKNYWVALPGVIYPYIIEFNLKRHSPEDRWNKFQNLEILISFKFRHGWTSNMDNQIQKIPSLIKMRILHFRKSYRKKWKK